MPCTLPFSTNILSAVAPPRKVKPEYWQSASYILPSTTALYSVPMCLTGQRTRWMLYLLASYAISATRGSLRPCTVSGAPKLTYTLSA